MAVFPWGPAPEGAALGSPVHRPYRGSEFGTHEPIERVFARDSGPMSVSEEKPARDARWQRIEGSYLLNIFLKDMPLKNQSHFTLMSLSGSPSFGPGFPLPR